LPQPSELRRFYGSKAWKDTRKKVLSAEPFCRTCGKVAEEVDHILTAREYPHLRLDPSNLRSLCSACHSYVRHDTKRGYSRQIGADGFPVDESHPFNRASRFAKAKAG
jgi:5-methylcytosine-specific restriction endonuclease McrA